MPIAAAASASVVPSVRRPRPDDARITVAQDTRQLGASVLEGSVEQRVAAHVQQIRDDQRRKAEPDRLPVAGQTAPQQLSIGTAVVVEHQQRAVDDQPIRAELAADGAELEERRVGVGHVVGLQSDAARLDVDDCLRTRPPRFEEPLVVVERPGASHRRHRNDGWQAGASGRRDDVEGQLPGGRPMCHLDDQAVLRRRAGSRFLGCRFRRHGCLFRLGLAPTTAAGNRRRLLGS